MRLGCLDDRRDSNPRCGGLAAQTTSSERKNPKLATKPTKERYPQGCPRGGEDEHPIRTDLRMTTQDNGIMTTLLCSVSAERPARMKGA